MADHTSSIRPTPAQAGAGRLFLKRQVSLCQRPELRPSTAIVRRPIFRN